MFFSFWCIEPNTISIVQMGPVKWKNSNETDRSRRAAFTFPLLVSPSIAPSVVEYSFFFHRPQKLHFDFKYWFVLFSVIPHFSLLRLFEVFQTMSNVCSAYYENWKVRLFVPKRRIHRGFHRFWHEVKRWNREETFQESGREVGCVRVRVCVWVRMLLLKTKPHVREKSFPRKFEKQNGTREKNKKKTQQYNEEKVDTVIRPIYHRI